MFPLQIWKQPHWIKCSDQSGVNEQDTNCFDHLHKEKAKSSVNVSALHAWIFLSTSRVFKVLQRVEEEREISNRIREEC